MPRQVFRLGRDLDRMRERRNARTPKPRVSVVIPNYNYARFLKDRFNSVLQQTFQDFEIVYLDDGSTDDSDRIVSEFLWQRPFRQYQNSQNTGSPFIQINKGVRLAQGELIWIAEADDYADPDFLQTMVSVLDRNPAVCLAYCQSIAVDETGSYLFSMRDHTDYLSTTRWNLDYRNFGRDECRRYLLYGNTIPNFSAAVFRRAIFERAGYIDESMNISGDWLTWIRMLLIADIAFVARPLNYYRWHAGSVRSRTGFMQYVCERYSVFDYLREHLSLTEHEMNIVLTKVMKDSLKHILREPASVRREDLVRTLQVALRTDPKFRRRLLWYLADCCSFGVLGRAWPQARDRFCPKLRPGRVLPVASETKTLAVGE